MRPWQQYLLLVALAGCKVGPNYVPPEMCVSDCWTSSAIGEELSTYEATITRWWDVFGDPLLTKYIEQAADYNHNLKAAEANVLEARAFRQITAAALFPQISGDFNASHTYFSKNGPVFAGQTTTQGANINTGLPFQIQIPQQQTLFNLLLDVTWEIDLFGKTRRRIEAAEAIVEASIERKNSILVSLFAEIARNYMELRSKQERGVLLEKEIQILEKKVYLQRESYKEGLSNKLDVDRIEADLFQIRAELPSVYAGIYQNIYALSFLVGGEPETLLCELLPIGALPKIPEKIAMGLRSDLLRRRPDIREAERGLAAATAYIGAAIAQFFPTITFLGDAGLQSLKWANLFTGRSKTWSVEGDVKQPIFTGGKLVGNLKLSEAAAEGALETYKQTVFNALQETEGALATYKADVETTGHFQVTVDKNTDLTELSEKRYTVGIVSLTDLLNDQQNLNTSSQSLLNYQSQALFDLILLYKALGGGWEISQEKCQ